ncbi:MAG: calcium/sodium antiporter [Rhodospirillales bacterium]|jgi:cation:H+ antiporter|nr:calcium/sodium antiporter [Rhodospirillales bacterium]
MHALLLIIGGLVLLSLGGDVLVRGAVSTARRLGVSELLIGLVIVGFGTSAPELITSVEAALIGSPGIAIGNVVGSNIANVLLIFAVVAIFKPIVIDPTALRRDGSVMIAATVLLIAIGLIAEVLSRWVGVVFLAALVLYVTVAWRAERTNGAAAQLHEREAAELPTAGSAPLWKGLLFVGVGLGMLMGGANLLVDGAIILARLAGLSETIIGLSVVAVGTSLPELFASLAAALKGRSDVAFGNIVGSNIYNILGILGATAVITPIAIPADLDVTDWAALFGSAVLLIFHAATGMRVNRWEGALLLIWYAAYIGLLFAPAGSLPIGG